ncbi:MAG: fibrobacter succinogenes major paralogous domain-containing protein, partial [Bacteroidales bacterium]|nr:fibrobacter succinogenes major paralogous domain-containing protein [Bacteroidales bacterium]
TSTASSDTTYSVKVTGECNSDSLFIARVKVYDTLKLTPAGEDTTYCKDVTAAALGVTATGGDGSYSYQWYANGAAISGATANTYTPSTATAGSNTVYSVKVTGNCSDDSVKVAEVGVYDAVAASTTSVDNSYCKEETGVTSLTISISGGHGAASYQWYRNGTAISGATADTYTPQTGVAGIYDYSAKASNECGSDSIHVAVITVNPTYNIPESRTVCMSALPYTWNDSVFTSAGSKTTTLHTINGCDSVVVMTLAVSDEYRDTIPQQICSGSSYMFNDTLRTAPGYYTQKLVASNGCDSITVLNLTVNPVYNVTDKDTVCESELPFVWNGVTFTAAGTQTTTLNTIHGCDSVVTMTLTVNPIYAVSVDSTICQGDLPLTWNDSVFTAAGTKTTTLHTVHGCDSVVTMTLNVNPEYDITLTQTINVMLLPFTWNDSVFTSPGVKTMNLKTVAGCDSIVHMDLSVVTVSPFVYYSLDSTICNDDLPLVWMDSTFTAAGTKTIIEFIGLIDYIQTDLNLTVNYSNTGDTSATACDSFNWYEHVGITSSGNYTHTFTNASGCDSVVTLHLTLGHSNTGDTTASACDSFTWYEHVGITSSGDYTHTFTNASGCDSVVTLHLTLGHSNTGDTTAVANYTFDWYEHVGITTSGDYTHTFTNASGCDSVVTLHLTVNKTTYGDTTAVACDSFAWRGVTYYDTPLINPKDTMIGANHYGCDSVVTLHLTVNKSTTGDTTATACDSFEWYGVTYTMTGNYPHTLTNAVGCDSVVTLHLTINNSYDLSENLVICQNDLPYTWRDTTFLVGTVTSNHVFHRHTAHGCDSTVTLYLTVNTMYNIAVKDTVCESALPYTWRDTVFQVGTVSGDYVFHRTSLSGCDSVVTLSLTVGHITASVVTVTDEICDNDGTITASSTGKAPVEYSIDGITFQSSNTFTGLPDGPYTITAKDADGCKATASTSVAPAVVPVLSITCPPDIHDTLNFSESAMKIAPDALGTPTATHSLSWPFSITNNAPSDSLYAEGDNVVTWVMTDATCGYTESCEQHVIIVFPKCPNAVDCEGHVYQGVRIGYDCWTQRNLESTRYSDCTDIPCVHNYVSAAHPDVVDNVNIFGRLYCYAAAIRDSADNGHGHIQGICPAGWYLPTPEKYLELSAYGTHALKSPLYWIPSGGDNSTGFTALPAGRYNGELDRFEGLLGETYFWSTSNTGPSTVISVYGSVLDCEVLIEIQPHPNDGYSVRCIKEKE